MPLGRPQADGFLVGRLAQCRILAGLAEPNLAIVSKDDTETGLNTRSSHRQRGPRGARDDVPDVGGGPNTSIRVAGSSGFTSAR